MTSTRTFDDATALLPEVIADTVLGERPTLHVPAETRKWFLRHCDLRLRYLYANNPTWRRKLAGEVGREHAYMFVRHWLDAMLLNQRTYRQRHPHSMFGVR